MIFHYDQCMKWMKWNVQLPKSNSDILTNFATTADFGEKGGKSQRQSKHKRQGNKGFHNNKSFLSQSEYGEKGGEVRRGPSVPSKEEVIWEKGIAEPIK